jgi:hypothetical protein
MLSIWQGSEPCLITILLRSSGDRKVDSRRMRQIHGLLSSHPGTDRFSFQVHEAKRSYDLNFPSYTTRYSATLHARLAKLVGEQCIRVESLRPH